MLKDKLLKVNDLTTYFYTDEGISRAVDGVDFEIYPGETMGLVGESGCGKSVTSYSIMRLIPEPPGKIVKGSVFYKGEDLLKLKPEDMREVRGNEISMIFQEPMTSLNPVFTIGNQIAEAILIHKSVSKREARDQSLAMLKKVGIPLPEQRLHEYPHQLSGGMRQRVMIAMALACNPGLLIADEPTTALDVTIQAQILELMSDLQDKFNMSILMITHDLGVIAEVSERVAVMYAGRIVEYSNVKTIFQKPKHPYTWGLLNSIPRMDKEADKLITIPGIVPNSYEFPEGCHYHPRCPLADEHCIAVEPELKQIEKNHLVSCWYTDRLTRLNEHAS